MGLADRSLDRANGAAFFQSRQELLQHEYKKVLQNHPSTISTNAEGKKFNENDLLRDMFIANNNAVKDRDDYPINILGRHREHTEECKSAQSGGLPSELIVQKSGSHSNFLTVDSKKVKRPENGSAGSVRKSKKLFAPPNEKQSSEKKKVFRRANSPLKVSPEKRDNKSKLNIKKVAEYKPSPLLDLTGEKSPLPQPDLLEDDDINKLERLQLINASARYELLSAN